MLNYDCVTIQIVYLRYLWQTKALTYLTRTNNLQSEFCNIGNNLNIGWSLSRLIPALMGNNDFWIIISRLRFALISPSITKLSNADIFLQFKMSKFEVTPDRWIGRDNKDELPVNAHTLLQSVTSFLLTLYRHRSFQFQQKTNLSPHIDYSLT